MSNKKFILAITMSAVMSLFFIPSSALAYDITDKFSVGGVMAGNYQYLEGDEDPFGEDVDDGGKISVVFQPEMSFRPYEGGELFAKFGFAANNGLNVKSAFVLATWAADLEDDVEDINGRERDYLLTS